MTCEVHERLGGGRLDESISLEQCFVIGENEQQQTEGYMYTKPGIL